MWYQVWIDWPDGTSAICGAWRLRATAEDWISTVCGGETPEHGSYRIVESEHPGC